MRLSTVVKLILAAAVGITVALIAAVKSIDVEAYKGFLTAQAEAATGRRLTIAGPLQFKPGLVPSVVATGVSFANMTGGSRPEMVVVERIEAEVALLPLLSRQIQIRRLVLVNPDVLVETDAKGRANWSFGPAGNAAAAAPTAGTPPTRFDAREVRIKNGVLTIRDGASGRTHVVGLERLSLQPEAGSGGMLALQFRGTFDRRPFDVQGRIGAPATAAAGKPWPLQIKATTTGAMVIADGTLAALPAGKGWDVRLSVQGDDLSDTLALAGVTVPPLGPYKGTARLVDVGGTLGLSDIDAAVGRRDRGLASVRGAVRDLASASGIDLLVSVEGESLAGLSGIAGTALPAIGPMRLSGAVSEAKGVWKLADLKGQLGGTDLAGELTLAPGPRPHVAGRLAATQLAVADLQPRPGTRPASAGDGRLFAADPLPLAGLHALDADLSLTFGRLTVAGVTLRDVAAEIHVKNDRLKVHPLTAVLANGGIEAELSVDASARLAAISLSVSGRRIDLGALLKEAGHGNLMSGGQSDLHATMTGRGDSVRTLMSGLSGEAVLSVGPGRVHNRTVDWAGGDLMLQMAGSLNPTRTDEVTDLRCAALRFIAKDGIAIARKGIAVETEKTDVVGAGTIDLRTERLDIGITPRARKGVGLSLGGTLAGVTRIRGTLAQPAIGIDELGTARAAASVGAAMATGGLSLLGEMLFDKATADSSPCQTALGRPAKRGSANRGGMFQGLLGR